MPGIERTPEDKLPNECDEPACDKRAIKGIGYCAEHAPDYGWQRGWQSEDGDFVPVEPEDEDDEGADA